MQTLQFREIESLKQILRGGARDGKIEWKVLVYDNHCRDIIAPLLKIGDLRKLGVTLHMLIGAERQPIKDAPAVYFMQPTTENLTLLCRDCKAELYQSFYLHFVRPVPRPLLEFMAQELVALPVVSHIKVFDQYLDFVALDQDLFTLQKPNSYLQLSSPDLTEEAANLLVDQIVGGLTAVILTLQVLPIVVTVRGGAAQSVADRICSRLSDLLKEHLLTPSPTTTRPVLLLCDRNNDLSTALAHTWTYRCLLHDVFGMKLNKVELADDGPQPKVYQLETTDKFFQENAGKDYPAVLEAATDYLDKYTEQKEQLTREGQKEDLDAAMESVSTLIGSVPLMKEQKRFVDIHINLCHALTSIIRARQLDAFGGIATQILNKDNLDRSTFLSLLSNDALDIHDKQRLFLVYYLCAEGDEAEKDVATVEKKLSAAGVPLGAYHFLKSIRGFARVSDDKKGDGTLKTALLGFGAGLGDSLAKAKRQLQTTLTRDKIPNALPLTRMVDAILQDPQTAKTTREKVIENLICQDPKTHQHIDLTQFRFNQAIVFVVGGGNYLEYQNLKDWERANQAAKKSVLYGSTDICNGEEFLAQLERLGGAAPDAPPASPL